MLLRGIPPENVPTLSFVGSPNGFIIGGIPGPQGTAGPPGQGLEITGGVDTYAELPVDAADNDAYVVLADGKLYIRVNGSWPANGAGVAFRGPTGPAGTDGTDGVDGATGDQGIQGEQGVQGETGEKGDTGDTGPEGPQGDQGIQGVKGDQGDQGIPGTGNGIVETIVAGTNIDVDSTDPANPIVSVEALTADDFTDGATNKSFTAAEKTKLAAISGTNTGDQNLSSYATTAAVAAAYQPLDADLTALAALSAPATKLAGIATGAEVNVNADWTSVTGDSQILNKPTTFAPTIGTTSTTAVAGNDARLTDTRTPSSLSVTNAMVSATAAISLSKLATGNASGSNNGTAADLVLWIGTAAQYAAVGSKSSTTVYVVTP
jgi:hypothetical protein